MSDKYQIMSRKSLICTLPIALYILCACANDAPMTKEKKEKITFQELSLEQLDVFTRQCYDEVLANEHYLKLNFNDTIDPSMVKKKAWSQFSFRRRTEQRGRITEMYLSGSVNPEITYYTMVAIPLCHFNCVAKSKSFTILNQITGEDINFRSPEGRAYFKECLQVLEEIFEDTINS